MAQPVIHEPHALDAAVYIACDDAMYQLPAGIKDVSQCADLCYVDRCLQAAAVICQLGRSSKV